MAAAAAARSASRPLEDGGDGSAVAARCVWCCSKDTAAALAVGGVAAASPSAASMAPVAEAETNRASRRVVATDLREAVPARYNARLRGIARRPSLVAGDDNITSAIVRARL